MPIQSPERQFIHDLANPLSTAMFVLDSRLSAPPPDAVAEAAQLRKALAALERVQILMTDRRAKLIRAEAETRKRIA